MKTTLILIFLLPVFVLSQTTVELDFIAPFSDNLAAVKKGDLWGFINNKGNIVIDFRDDLVLTETNGYQYPIFKNKRCLILENKNGIAYFGYIDETGKTVIAPEFLNALNFETNVTLVLKVLTQTVGENDILKKPVVYHNYFEVIIDRNGTIIEYLNPKGINVVLDKEFLKKPPIITSRFISDNIVTIMNENKKWRPGFISCNLFRIL